GARRRSLRRPPGDATTPRCRGEGEDRALEHRRDDAELAVHHTEGRAAAPPREEADPIEARAADRARPRTARGTDPSGLQRWQVAILRRRARDPGRRTDPHARRPGAVRE